MNNRPEGLWPFTKMVLDKIEVSGGSVLKIEAHDSLDPEEPDFIWGELTPKMELSEGEYLRIDQVAGKYYAEFGTRACYGGDPTFGGYEFLQPSVENASLVANEYVKYFTR